MLACDFKNAWIIAEKYHGRRNAPGQKNMILQKVKDGWGGRIRTIKY